MSENSRKRDKEIDRALSGDLARDASLEEKPNVKVSRIVSSAFFVRSKPFIDRDPKQEPEVICISDDEEESPILASKQEPEENMIRKEATFLKIIRRANTDNSVLFWNLLNTICADTKERICKEKVPNCDEFLDAKERVDLR